MDGRNQWLWTCATREATIFHVDPRRNGKVARGWTFVAFLGLVLRSRVLRMLRDPGLSDRYVVP